MILELVKSIETLHTLLFMENFLKGREKIGKVRIRGEKTASALSSLKEEPDASQENQNASNVTKAIPQHDPSSPLVELISQDGRITRIKITCTCGQVTELECEY